jgi:serine/threonine-protein kinase
MTPGIVDADDPPRDVPGMTYLILDDQSRLLYFDAVPPQIITSRDAPSPANWDQLFKAADLDPKQFQKADPQWTPLHAADERMAWTGVYPGTSIPARIEAAAFRGKPVFFMYVAPWTKPSSERSSDSSEKARIAILLTIGLLILTIPAFLAWRNIARGKADRRGAFRLSGILFCGYMLLWLFRSHFPAGIGLFGLFAMALATSLFNAALIWTVYLALEPYVRRHWPHSIISWSRLINGQVTDPAVGRDVLFGIATGMLWIVIFGIRSIIEISSGAAPSFPNSDYLEGARSVLGQWTAQLTGAVRGTLIFFFILFILRVLLRNKWLAAAAFVAIWTVFQTLGTDHPFIDVPAVMAVYILSAVALTRFGIVTLAAAVFTTDALGNLPMTMNPSIWYFSAELFGMATIVALSVWAFRAAIAGRKLFASDLFE